MLPRQVMKEKSMPLITFIAVFLTFLASSCSETSISTSRDAEEGGDNIDFTSLIVSQTGGSKSLAAFLDSGDEVEAIDVLDGAQYADVTNEEGPNAIKTTDHTIEKNSVENEVDLDLPTAMLPASSFNLTELQQGNDISAKNDLSLEELKKINLRKDQTIASLTRLNEELIFEIQRLRSSDPRSPETLVQSEPRYTSNQSGQLQKLQDEIALHKSSLIQKSHEINGLRIESNRFQNGIDSLQPRVDSIHNNGTQRTNQSGQINNRSNSVPPGQPTPTYISSISEFCSLEFDAVVTLLNGKNKEVFYTEFFLISKSFPNLLFDEGINLNDFPQVNSFEELWAQSRKSPFAYTGIYKRIRNVLLKQVELGTGYRVRTDIDGFGEFKNLPTGSFYLVGTAPVGKTGAVWNVPVRLRSGINKTSLTLANANWRE